MRNDSPCGSTIGPIMSAKLGMATIDVGSPQLSMHSIREMCDVSSVSQSIQLFKVSSKLVNESKVWGGWVCTIATTSLKAYSDSAHFPILLIRESVKRERIM